MPWFRERPPFRSPHFFFGTLALLLFVAGGYTGWRLKQGTERYADVRDIHGFLVYLALFIALAVAVMGFILLP
jgi:tryptophan-rich sensory protein